jgi:type IV pilus assembly protein PilQ
LFSDLGTTTSTGGIATIGLALARLPNGTLLDLELQALELESKTKTIARPKLVTTDQNKAVVEQGVDIPYQEKTSSGATSITYKKASLRLEVTPHITPDDKIWMDLIITNDAPVALVQDSAIKTNRLETKVLVNNGETIVLGGVLTLTKNKTRAKVPLFGDIPFIGAIFRNRNESEDRKELLIFITPKIIKPTVAS